jgi:SAM-dependent methyltransferase
MYQLTEDEINQARIWNAYADRGYLQSTIDPRDRKGLKCDYINHWSKYYAKKFVLDGKGGMNVLEIGCGSGRNLFGLAPYIGHGYGIDVAAKQIENAEAMRRHLKIENVSFFVNPDAFFERNFAVQTVFTMWVLQGFANDENLCKMLATYCERIPTARRFIFFEQIARSQYMVNEDGGFYKKIRTKSDYTSILSRVGLEVNDFKILNEKGFGPFYRFVYKGSIYKYWPMWLNLNKVLFALDRHLVHRKVANTFTDSVFVCARTR